MFEQEAPKWPWEVFNDLDTNTIQVGPKRNLHFEPEIFWRPLNFHQYSSSLRDRVIFPSIVLEFLHSLKLARFAESCHRSPRVSKVTRGVGLRFSIFDHDINQHKLYIIGVDSTMWIHRRLRWLRRVINDPVWAVSATRPMVPSNWLFEV